MSKSVSLKYSVSVGWFFTQVPLLARLQLARAAGFNAVEMFWPTDVPPRDLEQARIEAGVDVVLFNMNEGDYVKGDRGFACDPARRDWWRREVDAAISLAQLLHCSRINVLSGKVPAGGERARHWACFVENLNWAAPKALDAGIDLLIEPLNHLTHPTQLCQRTADVLEVLQLVQQPNVLLQYDVYHAQCSEGNIIATLRDKIGVIGHIQLADVPTRSAPGTGELNFANILRAVSETDYRGYVGLEYQPPHGAGDPFAWLEITERG